MRYLLMLVLLGFTIARCSNGAGQGSTVQAGATRPAYKQELAAIKAKQLAYNKALIAGANGDSLCNRAAAFLQNELSEKLFSYWKGTPWAFYGCSEEPGKGTIACGYFVTTMLRDAGVKLNRVEMAKTYSENMIKTLVKKPHIKKYVPFDLAAFCEELKTKGDAMYLVGLDYHTGFISVENGEVWFIHSTVLYPTCVMKEKALTSEVLLNNRYTVLGCFTADKEFMLGWIKQSQP